MWGSFDYNYAVNYAMKYSFGEENANPNELGNGRGGATLLLYNNLSKENILEINQLLGYGVDEVYTKDYEQFDKEKYGVDSKGAVNGVFQDYISLGYIGIFAFLFYAFSILFLIKNLRIRLVLIGFFCWEYFFYTGVIFKIHSISILFFYCIIYIASQKNKIISMSTLK